MVCIIAFYMIAQTSLFAFEIPSRGIQLGGSDMSETDGAANQALVQKYVDHHVNEIYI